MSSNKKTPYKDIKKKLHLLVLISKFYLSLRSGYFWDTLYNGADSMAYQRSLISFQTVGHQLF